VGRAHRPVGPAREAHGVGGRGAGKEREESRWWGAGEWRGRDVGPEVGGNVDA